MTDSKNDDYNLKLTGAGISIDRSVNESIAFRIMTLVMGGSVTPERQRSAAEHAEPSTEKLGGGMTAKAFMASKQPRNDMERIACLGYFLTHEMDTPQFKTKELTDLNRDAAQPKLSNPSAAARNAVTNNYLSLAGGGRKQMSARGEALVEALPSKEKVAAALEAHPIRKPRKSKAVKKKKGSN